MTVIALEKRALIALTALVVLLFARTAGAQVPRHHYTVTGFGTFGQSTNTDMQVAGGLFEFSYAPVAPSWLFFGGAVGVAWVQETESHVLDPTATSWSAGEQARGTSNFDIHLGVQSANGRELFRGILSVHPNVLPLVAYTGGRSADYILMSVAHGGRGAWRWRPNSIPIRLGGSVETLARSGLYLSAEVAIVVLPIVAPEASVELFGEWLFGLGAWAGPLLLGARAIGVLGAPGAIEAGSETMARVSVEPFVRLWADILEVELAVNLTVAGARPAWEELGGWGARLAVGARF